MNTSPANDKHSNPLFELMIRHGEKRLYNRAQFVVDATNDKNIYYVTEGTINVFRKGDNIVVGVINAPFMFGFALMFNPIDIVIKGSGKTVAYVLPNDKVRALISELNLWESVAELLSRRIGYYSYMDKSILGKDAYELISKQLQELIKYTLEQRVGIVTSTFIIDRTGLSRSRVMYILKQLKAGGYIKIIKGVLLEVNSLPKKF